MHSSENGSQGDDLLVVEAPTESVPNSPEVERFSNVSKDDFFGHGEDEEDRRSGLDEQRYGQPEPEPETPRPLQDVKAERQDSSANVTRPDDPSTKPHEASHSDSAPDDSLSDKENKGQHLYGSRQTPEFDVHEAPRPPPPARTNSADSSDRRSSRIPAPVSPVLSSVKRKPLELRRQSSNLSAASASSPRLGSAEWDEESRGGRGFGGGNQAPGAGLGLGVVEADDSASGASN